MGQNRKRDRWSLAPNELDLTFRPPTTVTISAEFNKKCGPKSNRHTDRQTDAIAMGQTINLVFLLKCSIRIIFEKKIIQINL